MRRAAGGALRRSRSALPLLVALLVVAPGAEPSRAGAEPAPAHPSEAAGQVPDVPAGPAALRGRVVDAEEPARAAGVEVILYALSPSAPPGLRRAVSDAEGRFAFEGISNDPATAYLIGARHAGVAFPGARIAFAAGETEHEVEVRIGEPREDAREIAVPEVELRIQWVGGQLAVTEVHRIENRGTHTSYVAPERRTPARALFRTRLPEGAQDFRVPLGIQPEGLVREGDEVLFYGPVYPSAWEEAGSLDQGITLQYTLPAESGMRALAKRFPRGAEKVVVTVPEGPLAVRVPGGQPEQDTAEGLRHFVVEHVPPGGKVALQIDVPPARSDPAALHLEEVRIFLELDQAALIAREEHLFRVDGDTPIVAADGEPLLAIPLPPGAEDPRFDRGAFALGLVPGTDGGIALDGPIPPGETTVSIAYRMPNPGGSLAFERRFARPLPLLSIFVADTGLRLESPRLHRRRPVRTTDRSYLYLEGFQVEPGEVVSLDLAPLAPRAGPPRLALYAAVAVLAALAAAALMGPLRSAGEAEAAEGEVETARDDREAVYAALRDLEHDHETGKISDEDHVRMRQELRGRALALLRAARGDQPAETPAETPVVCGACGAPAREGDRFCARCGARLEARIEGRGASA
jgi:cytochrome c-type biogenesis protein CcmI